MARIHIEKVIDHLSYGMRRALESAVEDEVPDADVDAHDLFRTFKRAVARKCGTWVEVPDECIE